jgi:hypothetical protein
MGWASLLVIVLLAALIPTAYAGLIGAPYVPARRRTIAQGFDRIQLSEKDIVIELGSGDGSSLLEAHKRGAKAVGFELSPFLWLISQIRTWRKPNITIHWKNFFKADINSATVIYLFLMPKTLGHVRSWLKKQHIPHGRYVLSYAFAFRDAQPLATVRSKKELPLYIYDLHQLQKGD